MPQRRSDRKEQILQSLAAMLESSPGSKITTAKLAASLDVSEAALYRHFPSKTRMYESLIDFVEETLFSRITQILSEESEQLIRCKKILTLFLVFCQRNPGITRILSGDALTGEHERLRGRVAQVYDRIETQLRQCLRMAEVEEVVLDRQHERFRSSVSSAANLLLCSSGSRKEESTTDTRCSLANIESLQFGTDTSLGRAMVPFGNGYVRLNLYFVILQRYPQQLRPVRSVLKLIRLNQSETHSCTDSIDA